MTDTSYRNLYQYLEEQKKASPSFCTAYANADVVVETRPLVK